MASKQVLVTYSERNKILTIPRGCGNDLEFLTEEFFGGFGVKSTSSTVTFEQFSEDWGCYVELERHGEIENKCKLKAVVVPTFSTPTLTTASGSLSTESLSTEVSCCIVPAIAIFIFWGLTNYCTCCNSIQFNTLMC